MLDTITRVIDCRIYAGGILLSYPAQNNPHYTTNTACQILFSRFGLYSFCIGRIKVN